MRCDHGDSFISFVRDRSQQTRRTLLDLPLEPSELARFEALTRRSVDDQKAIEAADTMPFEIYRQEYVSAARLGRSRVTLTQ